MNKKSAEEAVKNANKAVRIAMDCADGVQDKEAKRAIVQLTIAVQNLSNVVSDIIKEF